MPVLRAAAAALLLLAALPVPAANAANATADPVAVTVNARAALATVPDTGIGVNHAVWDTHLGSDDTADLLKDAGVQLMRYPGGSYSDIYHWEDNTAPGGYVAPNTDFDHFMAGVRRAGAQPMVTANYGTGTPAEAAAWVRYANVTKGYGVKFWEIGNENYGNGHYGAAWEADDHADKGPDEYARNVVAYADAMKAVDPNIKIGAVLTTAGNWPDGITADGDDGTWNKVVLSIAGPKIDFVITHWYPSGTGAAAFDSTRHIPDMLYLTRRQITQYAGPGSDRIGIAMTEFNPTYGANTQPGALIAADAYAGLLAGGVFSVDWWNVRNGIGTVSEVAGHTDYGDYGLLSSAGCNAAGVCEPALNTPFAPYYALRMLSAFIRPGDQMIRAATGDPLIAAHAARRPNGDLAVMLINRDPDNARPVAISYPGYAPAGTVSVSSFTNGATQVSTTTGGNATSATLPPYSLTTIVVHPAASQTGLPGAPGQPVAGTVTDKSATITWTASTAGSRPVAKYEVHRQNGAVTEQLGETPGTSFTVGNLVPGTRYTVNVIARDSGGGVSWASKPVTFTTGSPANSTCSVKFTDTANWGNGFVGSIDVTNNGAALNGWTLHFTWPTTWQSVSSGWNGTWTQNGTGVTVTSPPGSAQLATGATTNVGFVGGYSGPNVLPGVFTLNGKVCGTL